METKMKLINDFAEKVLNTKESFVLEYIDARSSTNKKYFHFIQANVFDARYIYGKYSYRDEYFYKNIDLNYELVAIVKDKTIYFLNEYMILTYSYDKNDLPENIIIISDKVKEENENAKNVLFKKFYDDLSIKEITDIDFIKQLKVDARKILFKQNICLPEVTISDIFEEQDIVDSICGLIDLKQKAELLFVSKKEIYINQKSVNEKIKQLMTYENIAADWELKIAEVLKDLNAKTVTVEFDYKDKKESIKINPSKIIEKLAINDDFDYYDFEIRKHGEDLLKKLEVNTQYNAPKDEKLTCKNINKISYGKKVLYEK